MLVGEAAIEEQAADEKQRDRSEQSRTQALLESRGGGGEGLIQVGVLHHGYRKKLDGLPDDVVRQALLRNCLLPSN